MSMRNFLKIPKIIVRKSADQAKDTKIPNYESAILIFRKYVYFYVALPLIFKFWRAIGMLGKVRAAPTLRSVLSWLWQGW